MGELALYVPQGAPAHLGVRRGAPHVELAAMVDALESCLPLEEGFKGNLMSKGWEEYTRTGKISKEAMQSNFIILHTLLGINSQGIFKRQQLKEALMTLDSKLNHKLSSAAVGGKAGKEWCDDEATLMHANLVELRRCFRNNKNLRRTPPWLKTLFEKLTSVNLQGDSQDSQACPTKQVERTPLRGMDSNIKNPLGNPHKRQFSFGYGAKDLSPKRARPLVYRKSQSPTKEESMESQDKEATFYYDKAHNLGVMVSKGKITHSGSFKTLAHNLRLYQWPCGAKAKLQVDCAPGEGKGSGLGRQVEDDDGEEEEEEEEEQEEQEEEEEQEEAEEEEEEEEEVVNKRKGKGKTAKGKAKA